LAAPFLSIVIPAYNEESRLPNTLEQIDAFLERQTYTAEVLVIENGSQDRTFEVAQAFAREHPRVCVLQEKGRGKGLAVRRGMLQAQGEYRFMCDADLSMPVGEINRFLPPAFPGADIVIGSREAPGSVRYNEPHYRHLGGRAVNTMIRLLILTGWAFDVELLYLARQRGYSIVELPIQWYFNPESKLNVVQDAIKMGMDILAIHWNKLRGVYDAKV
jgi:glycosyltransferase involved in cell wall biosynthesis